MFRLLKNVAILSITVLILMGSGSIVMVQEKQPVPKRILAIFEFEPGLPWSFGTEADAAVKGGDGGAATSGAIRIALGIRVYQITENGLALQADLDTWLRHYNEERVHSGKYCFGKTPMQTLLDSMPLVEEKTLDNNVQALPDCQIKSYPLQIMYL